MADCTHAICLPHGRCRIDAWGNRGDDCGHCTLLPSVNGWSRAVQSRCPVHGTPAVRPGQDTGRVRDLTQLAQFRKGVIDRHRAEAEAAGRVVDATRTAVEQLGRMLGPRDAARPVVDRLAATIAAFDTPGGLTDPVDERQPRPTPHLDAVTAERDRLRDATDGLVLTLAEVIGVFREPGAVSVSPAIVDRWRRALHEAEEARTQATGDPIAEATRWRVALPAGVLKGISEADARRIAAEHQVRPERSRVRLYADGKEELGQWSPANVARRPESPSTPPPEGNR
ncbi:hypothetical protein ABZ671_00655 [Micromonospora sp. NPDC006766]|uniref:hypothetical protein n=1 Tax=Micromonospora sp. NPDC006766 TaxID=3154778 RepID=UPI003411D6C0